MERAGEKLKRVRERLKLTFRDVEQGSQEIARRRGSDEFVILLSRLADIENKGTLPSIYRIYTMCALYRLDFQEVLRWYGVATDQLLSDAAQVNWKQTHPMNMDHEGPVTIPLSLDVEIDLGRTTFLSHLIRRWGKMSLGFLNGLDVKQHRYGFIGLEDWSMNPILRPGSVVLIDETRRKVATGGWTSELDRPIYFLEHREGFVCGWCDLTQNRLFVHPHPSSCQKPAVFEYPMEIDILGQVEGVAMLLDARKRPQPR